MKRSTDINIKPYISKRKKIKEAKEVEAPRDKSLDENASQRASHSKDNILDQKLLGEKLSYYQTPNMKIDSSNQHTKVISTLSWHPRLRDIFLSSSYDTKIILWNVQQMKLETHTTINIHDEAVKGATWNSDGMKILTASYDKTTKFYDVDKGCVERTFEHDDHVTSICVHPSQDNLFITGTNSTGLFLWDVRQPKFVQKYGSHHFGVVEDILFLPDQKSFVSSGQFTRKNLLDKTLCVWDFESTVALSNHIYQEPYTCSQLKLHPNKKSFLANSSAGYITIFNCQSPWKLNKYKRYEGHHANGYNIGFDISPCGSYIFCGDSDGKLFCYDSYTSQVKKQLCVMLYDANVRVAKSIFHPSLLICGSWGGIISLWR